MVCNHRLKLSRMGTVFVVKDMFVRIAEREGQSVE